MKKYGSTGSGEISSSQQLISSAGFLTSLMGYTDGVNDVDVIVYDNASSATGRVVGKVSIPGEKNSFFKNWPSNAPNRCGNGMYVQISGTGGSCIVEYQPCG